MQDGEGGRIDGDCGAGANACDEMGEAADAINELLPNDPDQTQQPPLARREGATTKVQGGFG
jgi:hypothetical protein